MINPTNSLKKKSEAFNRWIEKWKARLSNEKNPNTLMRSTNPAIIPRNHRIEQLISAAIDGDYSQFNRLHEALKMPYEEKTDLTDLQRPPKPEEVVHATFCGT